ncbi:unnamed protein product [Scytosiphon promiscuus]
MSTSTDRPTPAWLVQEPEGPGAPKTPGHWKTMWASDCARLEEAHRRGDPEVLVYGRKYIVDMKERTVRPLYWKEEPASKPVIRGTYFLHKSSGWLPYNEKDAELLEDTYAAAKIQLRSGTCSEVEIPLSDGENKVEMTRLNAGESVDEYFEDFEIQFKQKPVKPPSILSTAFYKTEFEVHRGSPEENGWGGVSSQDGEKGHEGEPPAHLVFVIHGVGESLWARSSSALNSVRTNMGPMRDMSAEMLTAQKKAAKLEAAAAEAAVEAAKVAEAEKGLDPVVEVKDGEVKGDAPSRFLPVEWFNQVHGHESVCEGLIQNITLPSIPGFRDFANQAILDVMYYLTPEMQASILIFVATQMNEMWKTFSRVTPGFSGKVSVMGHSLGSIIALDILMAQPEKGGTQLVEDAVVKDIPILSFYPEVLLACGSPIGTFLSIRSAKLDKQKLFKFNTTNRFFNLFHLYDPVAYRLEPLLDARLRDLPPEHVPHKGGDRIHVSVKKFNRGVNDAIDRMTKTTGKGWQAIQSSINTTIKSAIGDPGAKEADKSIGEDEVSDAQDKLKERIDWVIQESTLEGMHPWASAVFAHSSYFANFDLVMFLVNRLNEGLERTDDEEGDGEEIKNDGKVSDEATPVSPP